jgi:hypothetical protein
MARKTRCVCALHSTLISDHQLQTLELHHLPFFATYFVIIFFPPPTDKAHTILAKEGGWDDF